MKPSPDKIAEQIKAWGIELGFQQLGIADVKLEAAEERLQEWLRLNYHGEMNYMARHGTRRKGAMQEDHEAVVRKIENGALE